MPRPRKATKAKAAAGNPSKRKLEPNIESLPASAEPPLWIAGFPEAKLEWEYLVGERIRLGIHTLLTVNSYARYCVHMALFKRAIVAIDKQGLVTAGTKGVLAKSAACVVLLDLEQRLKPLEMEMGGTPKSQNFLHLAPGADPAAALLESRIFGNGEDE